MVRRGRGARVLTGHTRQHRPFLQRQMFWGAMSHMGPGPLVPINGTMNTSRYTAILNNHVVPYLAEQFPDGDVKLQQDNAPCHVSVGSRLFLQQQQIQVLDWPPYSPDLSPIENLWAILKQRLHTQALHTRRCLIERCEEIWNQDLTFRQHCQTLINSMPRRVQACIEARGGPVDY